MPDSFPLPIAARRDETPVDRTFVFQVPVGAENVFRFVPGQFLTIADPDDGVGPPRKRAYSLSSAPTDVGFLEVTVRDMGDFGTRFFAFEPGKVLEVLPPRGRFTLESGDDDVLLLSAGSGVTPFRSFVRHLAATGASRRLTLATSAKVPEELIFDREFRALAGTNPWFGYVPTVTRQPVDRAFDGRRGRIDETLVRSLVQDPARTWAYACGPAPVVASALGMAAAAGVPERRRKKEAWG